MTTLAKTVKKTKKKQYSDEGILESLREIAKGVATQGADTAKKVATPIGWEEMLGLQENKDRNKHKFSGDLFEGQELDLKEAKEEEKNNRNIEPGIDYSRQIVHTGERLASRETQEMEASLREIMNEIKKLADSSKELQAQFKEVAVEQHVVRPGKYHKNFFQWLLIVVRAARMKIEDSGAWLAATRGKHAKKGMYWKNSAEDVGGTSFSLSGERVVATQVG